MHTLREDQKIYNSINNIQFLSNKHQPLFVFVCLFEPAFSFSSLCKGLCISFPIIIILGVLEEQQITCNVARQRHQAPDSIRSLGTESLRWNAYFSRVSKVTLHRLMPAH